MNLVNPYQFAGGDPYWSSVVLLLHGEGANGSTTITDSSSLNNSLTAVGNCNISTSQFKFGNASILFDGTGDYINVANPSTNPNFDLSNGDFTIEAFVRPIATGPMLIYGSLNNLNGNGQLWFVVNATFSGGGLLQFGYNTTALGSGINAIRGTGTLTTSTWTHVAVCRSGANLRLFAGGVQQGITFNISTSTIFPFNAVTRIGQTLNGVTYGMNGNIDEFRMTKAARYTSNFTPPTAPFPDS